MYVRFVLPNMNQDTGVRDGLFRTAYALRRNAVLQPHEWWELDYLLRWFDANLAVPRRFNRTKSKGYWHRRTKGICWLKPEAGIHVTKMHRMADILREQGHYVDMIKTTRPGYVVYVDDHQIVAEPFKDLRG